MDAFAVSVCKGLALGKAKWSHAAIVGAYFGGFQAVMPLVGYFVGEQFEAKIAAFGHWVAFVLLALIGGKMIKESFEKSCKGTAGLKYREMLVLALATSIDAMAAGVTFALLPESLNIFIAVAIIGATTFVVSGAGVKAGAVFGGKYKSKAELAGGIVLVLMGVKILLEGLGVWPFK